MKKSKKAVKLSKQQKIDKAKKELEKTLKRSGYLTYLAKYPQGYRQEFPDLSVEEKPRLSPTSDKVVHRSGKHQLPEGAKSFPVGHEHKGGLKLIINFDNLAHMSGKKV